MKNFWVSSMGTLRAEPLRHLPQASDDVTPNLLTLALLKDQLIACEIKDDAGNDPTPYFGAS
ncbi:MAG: hypothetical protein ACK4OK_02735, partial [Thermoflexus sp.]